MFPTCRSSVLPIIIGEARWELSIPGTRPPLYLSERSESGRGGVSREIFPVTNHYLVTTIYSILTILS